MNNSILSILFVISLNLKMFLHINVNYLLYRQHLCLELY